MRRAANRPQPHRSTRVAAVAGAVLTAWLALAAPAVADTQAHRDPAHDVVLIGDGSQQPSRSKSIDVVSLRNTYEQNRLTLAMTTLQRLKGNYTGTWNIKVPDDPDVVYQLVYDTTGKKPLVTFTAYDVGRASCRGVTAAYHDHTLTAVVPRRCIDSAGSVRVAGVTARRLPQSNVYQVDDARQDGYDRHRFTYGPALTRN